MRPGRPGEGHLMPAVGLDKMPKVDSEPGPGGRAWPWRRARPEPRPKNITEVDVQPAVPTGAIDIDDPSTWPEDFDD